MGQVYHEQGRVSEGEDLLMVSIETLGQHGPRYELARSYLALGAAIASDVNRWDEARGALDQARAIFQELGAKLDLERIGELDSQLASGSISPFRERSEGDV
jgi:tetratricopeptide (TPR) repeat protein